MALLLKSDLLRSRAHFSLAKNCQTYRWNMRRWTRLNRYPISSAYTRFIPHLFFFGGYAKKMTGSYFLTELE